MMPHGGRRSVRDRVRYSRQWTWLLWPTWSQRPADRCGFAKVAMRNAGFLALAGGILVVATVLAVAFKAPRDATGPSVLAAIGGALLVQGAIIAFQRAGLGRGRRLGAVV